MWTRGSGYSQSGTSGLSRSSSEGRAGGSAIRRGISAAASVVDPGPRDPVVAPGRVGAVAVLKPLVERDVRAGQQVVAPPGIDLEGHRLHTRTLDDLTHEVDGHLQA